MSSGIVICSECRREVHQYGPKTWEHCEDRSQACDGATPVFPASTEEIAGKWCGRDGGTLENGPAKARTVLVGAGYLAHQTAMLQAIADGVGIPVEQLVEDPAPEPPAPLKLEEAYATDKPWREPKHRSKRNPNPKRHARRRIASASRKANR